MPDDLARVFAGVWPAHVTADAPPLLGACAVVGRRVLVPAAGARGPASHHARGVTGGVASDSAREVPLGTQSRPTCVDKLFETLILISNGYFLTKGECYEEYQANGNNCFHSSGFLRLCFYRIR